MEIKKVLSEYKNHVDKYYKNGISYWKNDKKMTEMLKKDKSDHLYVIEQMINENWVYAYKYWIGMDTASREQITNDAYDLLNEKNGHNKYAKGSTIKGGVVLQVGDMVTIMPNHESHYTNQKAEIVKEMPDLKTYEVKIKHKNGNEFVKFDKSELVFMGNKNKYANGGYVFKGDKYEYVTTKFTYTIGGL